jgi:G3E family GTPase
LRSAPSKPVSYVRRCADLLLLNKMDMLDQARLPPLLQLMQSLNTLARVGDMSAISCDVRWKRHVLHHCLYR